MQAIIAEKFHREANFTESATAIFIIAAVSIFVLANFMVGFSLPIYLFAMLFGFALSLIYPRSGVYAIVFLTFVFERFFTLVPIFWNRTEYKIYPLDILFAGVILGAIIKYLFSRRKIKLSLADFLVALFILASAIYFIASVYFFHADSAIAASTFKNYAFYGLFYFAIVSLFSDKEKLFQLLKFMLVGAVAITIFIFIGIIRGEGLWTEFTPLSTPGARILAFPHAFYLAMAVLISLAWMAFRKFKNKFFRNSLVILIPVWMIGIVSSLMRHLWISLFVSVIFLFYILPRENRKALKKIILHYVLLGIVFFVLAAYVSSLFPNSNFSHFFASVAGITGKRFVSTAQISSDESINWRRNVWEATWKEFRHSFIFGLGYGKKISVEIGTKYKDFVEIRNIHNSLLTIFIQMGLWSVGLFLALFYLLAKPAYRSLKNAMGSLSQDVKFLQIVFLALFVNYLIAFLFQTYLETNLLGIFFWIILGGLRILTSNVRSA